MTNARHLIVANRLEILADELADLLQTSPSEGIADPLESETILVQSKGMQHWLSLALADRNGVCANMRFPFPNAFLESLYLHLGGQWPRPTPFDPDMLTFRILSMMPELIAQKPFKPLKAYLDNQNHPLKAYQLAKKIGELFDQYQVYRPDLLLAWEKVGAEPADPAVPEWQPALWRQLSRQAKPSHRAFLYEDLAQRLMNAKNWPDGLPRRLAVFGISYLPPVHLRILGTLGRRIPIYLFLLNPCREFWFDIVSERQIASMEKRAHPSISMAGPAYADDLHFDIGNSLLASWGKLGRHFLNRVYQFDCQIVEKFQMPGGATLLSRLQQDILQLQDPPLCEKNEALLPPDGSIRIHACHSAMREMEVLHDQLLDIFEQHPHIQPRDVIVLTPDISAYAPFVHAVFGTNGLIPYSVADERYRDRSHLIEGFLQLLGLKSSRFEVSKIMALLDNPLIAEKAELEGTDRSMVRRWIQEANIRWGWDAQTRKEKGLPAFSENSWRDGLDRLLLGSIMAGNGMESYAGLFPLSAVEGNDRRILGTLADFIEKLYLQLHAIPETAALKNWADLLIQIKAGFFSRTEGSEHDHQFLDEALGRLRQIEPWMTRVKTRGANQEIGPGATLHFEVIRQHLAATLEKNRKSGGFIAGGVTFCAALPMRSIPAEVICMVGLNHDSFPRDAQEPAFNLMASQPRVGDRSQRDDDKYLFLETLVSARSVLYLSYIGRDIQDNTPIPSSVLVEELVDYLTEKANVRRDRLVSVHPLHAFSPRYFSAESNTFFSYAMESYDASRHLEDRTKSDPEPFMDGELPPPPESCYECQPSDVLEFFDHPTRYLFNRRLGIRFQKLAETNEDREPFTLNALETHLLEQQLLDGIMRGCSIQQTYQAVKSSGRLPHGTMGRRLHQKITQDVQAFVETLDSRLDGEHMTVAHGVDLSIAGFHVSGLLEGAVKNGVLIYRLGKDRPQDLLRSFISHIIAHLIPGMTGPLSSSLICKEAIWDFKAVVDAGSVLERYLNLYRQGLTRPLPFFPKSSFSYAHHLLTKPGSAEEALTAARKNWWGNSFTPGESQDPYLQRCFGNGDPLTREFEELALEVFEPVLSAGRRLPAGPVIA